ncbi:MAG: arginine deiminase family protein [bacterium]
MTILTLILIVPGAAEIRAESDVGSRAEWHIAKRVLMHTPGDELFMGIVHPDAALFEKPFSIAGAEAEHRRYIERLREHGATVNTVVETLLAGTLDEKGKPATGRELDALRDFAAQFLTIDSSALPDEQQKRQEDYKKNTVAALNPHELVQIILRHPTVHLRATTANTGLAAAYEESPVMNLYFLRDQLITTAKGVVISKMNSPQRADETKIIKFVLAKLGIKPIYEVEGEGRLEGGDYFSAGNAALIGQGLRTNAEGVKQLLDNEVFGFPRVLVVKDPWKNQEQMHLDTYFNIISPNLAVMVAERVRTPDKPVVEGMQPKVDVYELENETYTLKVKDADFQDYMEEKMGFRFICVPHADQLRYGINFLTIAANRILAIDGVSSGYKNTLKAAGVDATWMDFHNLTGGYGAAHCTTQVLFRAPN